MYWKLDSATNYFNYFRLPVIIYYRISRIFHHSTIVSVLQNILLCIPFYKIYLNKSDELHYLHYHLKKSGDFYAHTVDLLTVSDILYDYKK